MGAFDYSNLANRAKAAKESKEAGQNPIEEGDWNCVFQSGELTKSRKGSDMVLILAKCKVKDDEEHPMHNKELKLRYVLSSEFQLDSFLNLMAEAGVDLGKVTHDKDWAKWWDKMEEARTKMVIRAKRDEKDPRYNKFTVLEVEPLKAALQETAAIPATTAPGPAPKKQVVPKTPKAVAVPVVTEADDEETDDVPF